MNAAPLGALLRREVITQLRRVRSFVMIVIVLLVLVWIVAASWPSGSTLVWAQLPLISTGLLTGIVFYLLIGAGLFVPGIAGTAIVDLAGRALDEPVRTVFYTRDVIPPAVIDVRPRDGSARSERPLGRASRRGRNRVRAIRAPPRPRRPCRTA